MTPTFWIDIGKLFEVYVLRKLSGVFQEKSEVTYHYIAQSNELDFPTNYLEQRVLMIVDTI